MGGSGGKGGSRRAGGVGEKVRPSGAGVLNSESSSVGKSCFRERVRRADEFLEKSNAPLVVWPS